KAAILKALGPDEMTRITGFPISIPFSYIAPDDPFTIVQMYAFDGRLGIELPDSVQAGAEKYSERAIQGLRDEFAKDPRFAGYGFDMTRRMENMTFDRKTGEPLILFDIGVALMPQVGAMSRLPP